MEYVLHVNKEGVVDGVKNIFLKLNIVHLLVLNNDILTDALHSIQLAWMGHEFDKVYLAKCTFSNQLLYFKVFKLSINFASVE